MKPFTLAYAKACLSWKPGLSDIGGLQNYWVFGLCPSSGILKNTTFWKLDLFLSPGEGVGDVSMETDPVYEFSRIPDDGQSKKKVIPNVRHHCQNPLESNRSC
jgi:hypothetical protein